MKIIIESVNPDDVVIEINGAEYLLTPKVRESTEERRYGTFGEDLDHPEAPWGPYIDRGRVPED